MNEIRALKINEVKNRWGELAPRFMRALERDIDGHKSLDILRGVESGDVLVLELDKTVMAIEITEGGNGRNANIIAFEGESGLQAFQAYDDVLTALALEQHCDRLTLRGRSGWRRALKAWGWLESTTILTKELN